MVIDRLLAHAVGCRSSNRNKLPHNRLVRRHAVVPHQGLDAPRPLHRVVAPGGISIPVGLRGDDDDAAAAAARRSGLALRVSPTDSGLLLVTGRLVVVAVQQILETGRSPESLHRRPALGRLAQCQVKILALELVHDSRSVLQFLGAVALRVLPGHVAAIARRRRLLQRPRVSAKSVLPAPDHDGALRRLVPLVARPRRLLVLVAGVIREFPLVHRELGRRAVHNILRVRAERQVRLEAHVVRD